VDSPIAATAILTGACLLAGTGCGGLPIQEAAAMDDPTPHTEDGAEITDPRTGEEGLVDPLPLTDDQWRGLLTPEQFRVLREKGTEQAFTGAYWDTKSSGEYRCAACGHRLFSSDDKYDSGSGWPSFTQPLQSDAVGTTRDRTLGMLRTEVICGRCGSHLGHVFLDGPPPTGLRYCINSVSLKLSATEAPSAPDRK